MIKLFKLLAYLSIMLALIIFFSPKVNAYYQLELLAKEQNIYVSDERVKDSGFSLNLYNAKVYLDELFLAEAKETSIATWLVYNHVKATDIKLNSGFSAFMPEKIEYLEATHIFYNPTHVTLEGQSGGNTFEGDIDLLKRLVIIHLHLDAKSKKKFAASLRQLKKEEGGYIYEYRF